MIKASVNVPGTRGIYTSARLSPGPTRSSTSGLSLIELTIVISLVIILFLVAADRLLPLRGQAEAAHVDATIGALRSALGLEAARRIVQESPGSLTDMQGINPMALLEEPPRRYAGTLPDSPNGEMEPGHWYFDSGSGTLVYRVRFARYLADATPPPAVLSWQVMLQYEDQNATGQFDHGTDRLHGIDLKALVDHHGAGEQAAP